MANTQPFMQMTDALSWYFNQLPVDFEIASDGSDGLPLPSPTPQRPGRTALVHLSTEGDVRGVWVTDADDFDICDDSPDFCFPYIEDFLDAADVLGALAVSFEGGEWVWREDRLEHLDKSVGLLSDRRIRLATRLSAAELFQRLARNEHKLFVGSDT